MNFWENKRVLVTGGTGFLGRVVTRRLKERGCREVLSVGKEQGDLLESSAIAELLKFRPELVIHLAAVVGGIGANQARPAEFFYQNLMMGAQLMHACWQSGVA